MIDPRFPPQPRTLDVPLYSLRKKIEARAIADLLFSGTFPQEAFLSSVKEFLPESGGKFYFRDSASSCLADYVCFRQKELGRPLTVALPAFCCPHFCMRIMGSGAHLVFLDVNESYGFSRKSISFAAEHDADMLIWPSFFGTRTRCKNVLAEAQNADIEIIFDEAQSFPNHVLSSTHISLLSFGQSKRMQGIGGGALYFPAGVHVDNFIESCSGDNEVSCKYKTIGYSVSNSIRYWIDSWSPKSINWAFFKHQKELPTLLNLMTQPCTSAKSSSMTELEFLVCVERMKRLKSFTSDLHSLFLSLCEFIKSEIGGHAIEPSSCIQGLPSIFAIRVKAQDRYNFCTNLARRGIQTTWYYYPLNMIKAFSAYPCEEIKNTSQISSEIIIFPFGLGAVSNGMEPYLKAIGQP